jgi:hypothetical protein
MLQGKPCKQLRYLLDLLNSLEFDIMLNSVCKGLHPIFLRRGTPLDIQKEQRHSDHSHGNGRYAYSPCPEGRRISSSFLLPAETGNKEAYIPKITLLNAGNSNKRCVAGFRVEGPLRRELQAISIDMGLSGDLVPSSR